MQSSKLIEKFEDIVHYNINRDGIDDLMQWIRESDFYTAPASTRYHGAEPGGLLQHSIDVYRHLVVLNDVYHTELSIESMAICALFHDLCKVNFYKPDTRNVKGDDGVWRKVPCYSIDEKFPFGGHGSKSMYLVQHFMTLEPDEAAAINCHMGEFDATQYSRPSNAYAAYPLAFLLHVADEAACFLNGE